MRVVGGVWAGRPLLSPGGRVRPTAEDVRAAALRLIGRDARGARVLDLFAGTGALGIEALSQGARRCDFVENGAAALHALKANVAALRLKGRTRIFVQDAIQFAARLPAGAYDVAFVDPPYGSAKLDRILAQWQAQPFSRLLLVEHDPGHALPRGGERLRIRDSALTLLRAPRGGTITAAADSREDREQG
jgi:16S rRNA (guanine966-N2)-methyltransferase